uniref:Ig-like domain-containing protein n=1 Tax=Gasterosteus aculeatus aculeatus TaxID=481459 RepID=A0AAQ4Q4P1_GASAC
YEGESVTLTKELQEFNIVSVMNTLNYLRETQPKAQLSKDSPVEGSVTLTCSVGSSSSSSSGWKYFWYRDKKTSEPLKPGDGVLPQSGSISPSDGGVYWCRGGRGDPVYYTEYSHPVVTNRAVVTLQKNWPEIYSGETISLTCGVKEGGGSEWEYEWRTPDYYTPQHPKGSVITYAQTGDYSCKGRLKDEASTTEWSDAVTLKTSRMSPVLTVSPSWTSPGDSVTLTCSVEPPSAGWRFFWYQAVPELSLYYTYELLAGSTTGTVQDSYSLHGQTHTAGYVCRAGRGDPVFYTLYSDVKFVWSGGVNPAASLTVSPHRLQHFSTESLSLSCEGNSTEWRVMKASNYGHVYIGCNWGQMTGSTCNTDTRASSGVYWCESATQSSNAANITTHSGDVILVSSVHPVTEGHSVTLGCMLRTKELLDEVDFYKNDKLLPNPLKRELFISAVTKSDEGFYKCRGRNSPPGLENLTSAESWLSVEQAATSSVFLVLLVVGLVSGVLLIILLLLFLRRYRKSKGEIFSFLKTLMANVNTSIREQAAVVEMLL